MRRTLSLLLVVLSAASLGAVDRTPVDSATMAAHPGREYYQPIEHYTIGNFFSALDVPTNFGVGFIPDKKSAEQFAYYSAMFLEWRRYRSFGGYFQAGLDSHDHNYNVDKVFAGSEQFGDRGYNVKKGTVFNMQLMAGGGYKIPLIPISQFHEFYEHPWLNRWNLGFLLQIGASWSRTKYVVEEAGSGSYRLEDQHHVYPVMKVGTALEVFTGSQFSVFLAINYMQHLMRQPWDSPNLTGTLNFGIGFAGFFN